MNFRGNSCSESVGVPFRHHTNTNCAQIRKDKYKVNSCCKSYWDTHQIQPHIITNAETDRTNTMWTWKEILAARQWECPPSNAALVRFMEHFWSPITKWSRRTLRWVMDVIKIWWALRTYFLVGERKCRQIRGSLFGSIFIKFKCEVAQYAAESECYCAPLWAVKGFNRSRHQIKHTCKMFHSHCHEMVFCEWLSCDMISSVESWQSWQWLANHIKAW